MRSCLTMLIATSAMLMASTASAQNRTGGGAAGIGGAGQGANVTAPNSSDGNEINVSAGSSESIERDFGTGFIGASDSTGRFIGSQFAGDQSLNAQSQPNFQQLRRQQNRPEETTSISKVRPVLRIGFRFARNSQALAPTRLASLKTTLPSIPEFEGIRLTISDDQSLSLQGYVPDERSGKLAEAYLRLEPGITRVINELRVIESE